MSEIVERVAAAIRDSEQMHWNDMARAAIEAMRYPTAEMLNKGIDCPVDDIKVQWQAMIDEALK